MPRRDPRAQTELPRGHRPLADFETANDVEVSLRIDSFQVIQQPTPATHHLQQAPPTGVILLVRAQVLRQFADPGGQNGDLHLGRASVAIGTRLYSPIKPVFALLSGTSAIATSLRWLAFQRVRPVYGQSTENASG